MFKSNNNRKSPGSNAKIAPMIALARLEAPIIIKTPAPHRRIEFETF